MTTRAVQFKPDANIVPCPQCGNKTHFVIHSAQVAEDYCELWASCHCGHQPAPEHAFEDVWGGVNDDNVQIVMSCWNDAFSPA
ncbi:MAG: hypothetical protein Q7S87_03170 [Agitococcus sp.]|nr:hypothetical protein [Agitococcus sp.]MDO9178637.1 hypothetical protein [Agitococcus sp.]